MMRSGVAVTFKPFERWRKKRQGKKRSRLFACGTSRQVKFLLPSLRQSNPTPPLPLPPPLQEAHKGQQRQQAGGKGPAGAGGGEGGVTPGENIWGFLAPR